jgi:hypothetical protein
MRVRNRLPTRCLCVGLSLLAVATPVSAAAQDALPFVEGVQPVATSYPDAMRLASPLSSDRVNVAADENRAIPNNAGDRTQGTPFNDAAAARMAAEADAKRDVDRTGWIVFGVITLWIAPVVAYAVPRNPPAVRLMSKTPEYTSSYTETWKRRSKARRAKYAWTGAGIGTAMVAAIVASGFTFGG